MIGLVTFCVFYYFAAGVAMVLGYHRCLTHRSFRLRGGIEYLIIFLGIPAGTPIQWVANHRYHHIHADSEKDPHSPIEKGFWYAHNGWYINSQNSLVCFLYALGGPLRMIVDAYHRPISNQTHNHLAKDVAEVTIYRWLSKPVIYRCAMVLHLVIPYCFVWYFWSGLGVLLLWLTQIIIYNLGDSINSLGHEDGHSEYGEHNKANNRPIWALLTFGDAFHADHHEYPNSAKLNIKKTGIDIGWILIVMLKKLGLAYDVKTTALKNKIEQEQQSN